jgi:hypothetical protein
MLAFQLAGPPTVPAHADHAVAVTRALHPANTVTPVINCAQLQSMDFSQVPGAPTEITSVATTTISGASYCEVKGEQPPEARGQSLYPGGEPYGSSPWGTTSG